MALFRHTVGIQHGVGLIQTSEKSVGLIPTISWYYSDTLELELALFRLWVGLIPVYMLLVLFHLVVGLIPTMSWSYSAPPMEQMIDEFHIT